MARTLYQGKIYRLEVNSNGLYSITYGGDSRYEVTVKRVLTEVPKSLLVESIADAHPGASKEWRDFVPEALKALKAYREQLLLPIFP